jgi:pyruvate dehydrogenase (quinone)
MGKKRVGQVIVEALADAGVSRCYGIAGDTLNHITDPLRIAGRIAWVHVRHEEAGGFAAGAEAQLTGRLAACAGTCGPGSLHFINGLFESNRNRAPVVLIATQVGSFELGLDFPQELDLRTIYRTCSVFCEELRAPSEARRLAVLACQAALTRRGVAVLIVPGDIAAAQVDDDVPYQVHAPAPVVVPSNADLDRMAAILGAGRRVAVYAGAGAEGAHDEVVELCAALNAPVAHTSRAKDFIEYDNPFSVGMTGLLGVKSGYEAVTGCDTLLLLGTDFAWRQFYPDEARLVQVDADPTHLGRRHPVELGVVGDVKQTLRALLPRLTQKTDRTFLDKCLEHVEASRKALLHEERAGEGGLIHPQRVAALISRHADDDAVFTADGGSPMVWLLRHVAVNGRRRTLLSLLHGTMANAMPMALGAQKAFPGRQVIAFSGDGGIAMLLGDLLTAVQEEIPIKVVVFNNGTLGFVEMEMKVEGILDAYTKLKNPDFARLAEVIGFRGRRVEHGDDLDGTVREFLAHPGPALLDVVVNGMELIMPPTVDKAQVFSTALYGAKAILSGRAGDVVELVESNFVR